MSEKNQKGFSKAVVVVLVLIALLGGGIYVFKNKDTVPLTSNDPLEKPKTEKQAPKPNFITGGMVFDENRKTGAKEWTFLYDEKGRMAVDAKLIFDENSLCDLGKGEKPCDMDAFDWEDYAEDSYFELEGYKEGQVVTVAKMKAVKY